MDFGSYGLLIVVIVAFGALLWFQTRARRRQQQQQEKQRQELAPGVEVMTSTGFYGTVVSKDESTMVLSGPDGSRSKWDLRAVAKIITDEVPQVEAGTIEGVKDTSASAGNSAPKLGTAGGSTISAADIDNQGNSRS